MATHYPSHLRDEFRGAVETTTHGFSGAISPILVFVGFFGSQSLGASFWATLVTAILVPAVAWFLKSNPALHYGSRTASLTAYAALIFQLSLASSGSVGHDQMPTAAEFVIGLAAGSLLFALASLLVLLAGLFKLGHIFKMIPNTVTAGISNSTAVLLMLLAFSQVWGPSWQAGITAGAMLMAVWLWSRLQQRINVLRVVPTALVAVLAGLLLTALIVPPLARPTSEAQLTLSWTGVGLWPQLLNQAHLKYLLLQGLPGTLTLALVMILESFTAHHVMESRYGVRSHANRELVALGGSNLLSAVLGGVPCTVSPIRCVSNWQAGGRGSRALWLALGMTGLLVLVLGNWLLMLPAGMIAGLFLLQVPLMIDPTFKTRLLEILQQREWRRAGSADMGFWITLVITLAGIFGNLIWACSLGIGLSCLAVLRRVSGSLTSRWVYLDHYRSRRIRSLSEITTLEQATQQVGVLQLTGHLFFGNSTRLTQLIDELDPQTIAVVLDVSRVHDVDSSGVGALVWLIRALVERDLCVVLTGNRLTESEELSQVLKNQTGVIFSLDLDRGLELCEERVLQRSEVAPPKLASIEASHNSLLKALSDHELSLVLMSLETRVLTPGEALFYQDDPADGIWLLEEGMVSVLTGSSDGARLATFGPGQFVGEMGFVDGQSRSAMASADTPLRAAFLSHQSLTSLAKNHPNAALKISLNIARELSLRMRNTTVSFSKDTTGKPVGWANSELLSTLSRF